MEVELISEESESARNKILMFLNKIGINEKDIVVLKNKKFVLPKSDVGSNPFTTYGQKKDKNAKK